MPSPFQSKFLPWNPVVSKRSPFRNPFALPTGDPNSFGTNADMAFPEQQGTAPEATAPKGTPYSLMDEYKKIASNRPNRLAYQQAVQEGSPVIDRGKWAKLGAAIAAGGSALGGMPADRASALGLSAYYEPQRKSDERYNEKVKGLGQLAQFEDSDVQEQIKMLEAERRDYYDQKAEGRAQTQEGREAVKATQESELHPLQIQQIKESIKKSQTKTWEDKSTGLTWEQGPDGTLQSYKTGLSTDEDIEKQRREAEAKAKFEREHDERMAASALNVANAGVTKSNYAADKRLEGVVKAAEARNNAVGKALTPGQKAAKQWNDLSIGFNSDPDLKGLSIKDFVDITVGPAGTQMITPKPSWEIAGFDFGMGDTEKEQRVKDKISAIITRSLSDGGSPAAAGTGTGKADSGGLRGFINK